MKFFLSDELDSTNLEAKRLWPQPGHRPYAVVARRQTGGMGRNGRAWHSPRGGLWMTVAWPLAEPLAAYQALPLVAGLAAVRTFERLYGAAIRPEIKWPNDILVGGRKVCGILCQGDSGLRPAAIFAGIGINGDFEIEQLGSDLRQPATTLRQELPAGVEFDLDALGTTLIAAIEELFGLFEKSGLAQLKGEIERHLCWVGEPIVGEPPGAPPVTGILSGIDGDGGLVLETQNGPKAFLCGDIDKLRLV